MAVIRTLESVNKNGKIPKMVPLETGSVLNRIPGRQCK